MTILSFSKRALYVILASPVVLTAVGCGGGGSGEASGEKSGGDGELRMKFGPSETVFQKK